MHIRIIKADRFKSVIIAGEEVVVGKVTAVTDSFVHRLETEFPHFEFEKNVTPEPDEGDAASVEQAPGEQSGDAGGDSKANAEKTPS